MDNFFPSTATVDLRDGREVWASGLSGGARSLLPYNSQITSKLFCSTSTGIYDVTVAGTNPNLQVTCTDGEWSSVNFANIGGSFMLLANGVDPMKSYNGTAWAVPAITGLTSSTVNSLTTFKRRVWMVPNFSMTPYYLDIDAIQGPAHPFPMGPVFSRGGYIIAQATWTVDGGQGADDLLVTVTSEGEIAVYQGTDPASLNTFALVGVYYVGKPVGKKCFMKYGGDLLFLGKQGLFQLSKLLLSATIDRTQSSISSKIDGAIIAATESFANNFGWSMALYPGRNALVLNVPVLEGAVSYQFVMNTITKAWCRFTNWNAVDFVLFNEAIFCCVGDTVYHCWAGLSDAGVPITGTCQQAYNNLRGSYQKQVTLTKPNILALGGGTLILGIDADYQALGASTEVDFSSGANVGLWDSSTWDGAIWDSVSSPIESHWVTVPNNLGYFHSFRLQFTSSTSRFSWVSTDYAARRAGIL